MVVSDVVRRAGMGSWSAAISVIVKSVGQSPSPQWIAERAPYDKTLLRIIAKAVLGVYVP